MRRLRIALPLAAAILLAAALVALALFGVFTTSQKSGKSTNRSKGGLTAVLRVRGRMLSAGEMRRSQRIMNERLIKAGVAEFELRTHGSSEISLWIGRGTDVSRTLSLVTAAGQLEFFDLETSLVPGVSAIGKVPQKHALNRLLKLVTAQVKAHGASSYYLFDAKHELVVGPIDTLTQLNSSLLHMSRPQKKSDVLLAVPKSETLVSCDLKTSRVCPDARGGFLPKGGETWYYLFRLPAQMTNRDLNAGGIRVDFGQGSSGPIVDLSFTSHGDKVFHQITRDEWARGQILGPQHFAVVLDGRLITFPSIQPSETSLSDGIDPSINGAIIQGIVSVNEAKDIAAVLQTGALPAQFEVVPKRAVPARSGG